MTFLWPDCFWLCAAPLLLRLQEALSWTEQAVSNPAYCNDALALQAGLYLEKRDYHHAKQARGAGRGVGTYWAGVASHPQPEVR